MIEDRLRLTTRVSENQFDSMPGRSIMETISLLKRLIKLYQKQKKDFHIVFIDLEKIYDRVSRKVLW